MSATLILHQGGIETTREQLNTLVLPPPTRTWKPISHATVLDRERLVNAVSETHRESDTSVGRERRCQIERAEESLAFAGHSQSRL